MSFPDKYQPRSQKTYLLTCAPKEDSNQPAHLRSLIWVFVVRLEKLCILGNLKCASEDSDQTARMRKLIWIFAEYTCQKVFFSDVVAYIVKRYVFWRCGSYLDNSLIGRLEPRIFNSILCRPSGISVCRKKPISTHCMSNRAKDKQMQYFQFRSIRCFDNSS